MQPSYAEQQFNFSASVVLQYFEAENCSVRGETALEANDDQTLAVKKVAVVSESL